MNTAPTVSQGGYALHHATGGVAKAFLAPREESFVLREDFATERGDTESFIQQCFATAYGARIARFMPRLLSLHTARGDLVAALGLREAADSSLYLETYLDQPIEDILHARLGKAVGRNEIIEVGNLSTIHPGTVRWLIVALTSKLHAEGYKWVTFTGTSALRNAFCRLGLRPVKLGVATSEHLPPAERILWGSYYDQQPMVMAGDIVDGYRFLHRQGNASEVLRAGGTRCKAA